MLARQKAAHLAGHSSTITAKFDAITSLTISGFLFWIVATTGLGPQPPGGRLLQLVAAERCQDGGPAVFGENSIIDQLTMCAMSKSFDLDLTPHGDTPRLTARTLVDQGLSDETNYLYGRLTGLWTIRRARPFDSAWKCGSQSGVQLNAVVQVSNLALEVVEKIDISLHRSNQHKLNLHKPCKTFDLPLWMCRQSKPIYRSTKTFVNRAYFNLTLSQARDNPSRRPEVQNFELLLTCPETFKQKISYSPSVMYILPRHLPPPMESPKSGARGMSLPPAAPSEPVDTPISHPVSFVTTQDGKKPSSPQFQNSVNTIVNLASRVLKTSFRHCLQIIEADLTLYEDFHSFYPLNMDRRFPGVPVGFGNDLPENSAPVNTTDTANNHEFGQRDLRKLTGSCSI